ncbi:hypothetical protein [Thiomicrospira sp.]|nr:hypothetical protein [Thiomicrospira sp.]
MVATAKTHQPKSNPNLKLIRRYAQAERVVETKTLDRNDWPA